VKGTPAFQAIFLRNTSEDKSRQRDLEPSGRMSLQFQWDKRIVLFPSCGSGRIPDLLSGWGTFFLYLFPLSTGVFTEGIQKPGGPLSRKRSSQFNSSSFPSGVILFRELSENGVFGHDRMLVQAFPFSCVLLHLAGLPRRSQAIGPPGLLVDFSDLLSAVLHAPNSEPEGLLGSLSSRFSESAF